MALLSLFFTKQAKLGVMELDVSLSETHEASAQMTQSEIEDGSTITDSITLAPIKLTIEGVISQTPLGSSALVSSLATAAGGVLGKTLGGSSTLAGAAGLVGVGSMGGLVSKAVGLDDYGAEGKSRKPEDVFKYLIELREKRIPFEVVTGLQTYQNMVLTNLSVPRNAQTVGILRFSATLEQVKIVSSQTIDVAVTTALGGKAAAAAKAGKQGASQASDKVASNSTTLRNIVRSSTGR